MRISLTLPEDRQLKSLGEVCYAATALDKCRKEMESSLGIPAGKIIVVIPSNGIELFGSKNEEHILKQAGIITDIKPRERVFFTFKGDEVKPENERELAWIDYVLVSQKEDVAVVELMLGCLRLALKTSDYEGVALIRMLKCRIAQAEKLGPVTVLWNARGEWEGTDQTFDFPIDEPIIRIDPY